MQALRNSSIARVLRSILILTLVAAAVAQFAPISVSSETPILPPNIPAFNVIPHEETAGPAAIEGWVKSESGEAVSGAVVLLNSRVEARSDESGYFSFSPDEARIGGMAGASGGVAVQLSVRSAGHADWSISNAIYYPGDALRVHPRLGSAGKQPSRFTYTKGSAGGKSGDGTGLDAPGEASMYAASAAATGLTPPATIRVYRTRTGVVEVVPFKEYVKHSLPTEWVPSWPAEALKAGAMAVKSYAWYWVSRGGKQVALGADVKDNTDDQVYDPNVSYASTDAAVDATFNYALTMNGSLFQTQYCAGSYDPDPTGDCPWGGPYMTQWGSSYYSDQGKSWAWILQFYYPGSAITPEPPGYKGPPPPTATVAAATRAVPAATPPGAPPAPPPSGNYVIGQGQGNNPEVFQEAYARNGGLQTLGKPTGPVRWWLQYVTEFNLLAQPFSGPDGKGNVWIVYDVLKASIEPGLKAFVISGDIATFYANSTPTGSEWLGAPTSDPYVAGQEMGGQPSQGFVRGMLTGSGQNIRYVAWPQQFTGWKADYFVGHPDPSSQAPATLVLPGRPALVKDVPSLDMEWQAGSQMPSQLGVGKGPWSAQFTREFQMPAGLHDFTLSANSGARLWLNGRLVIDGWQWKSFRTEKYIADLPAGSHAVRVQYYSPTSAARLSFSIAPQSAAPPPTATQVVMPPTPVPPTPIPPTPIPPTAVPPVATIAPAVQPTTRPPAPVAPGASLRVRVRWLGRPAPPHDSWVQPLTLYLSAPADPTAIRSFRGTTDRHGVAFFQNLPTGMYNVHVKGQHSIQSARANITLMNNATVDVDMQAQVEGDVDGDNCVTVYDFEIVQAMLGVDRSTPGYNAAADINGDGEVSMTDVSLLRSGFDMCGDISADTAYYASGVSTSPGLSETLAPWLNPEGLQRTLSLGLTSSATTARIGQVVTVNVVANAASQPIDGASFVLRFDASRLQPIDAEGNLATNVEPGVSLPAVMGNWVDAKGGATGYSAGILQGQPPSGQLTIARLRFRVIGAGQTQLTFDAAPSRHMQLTNGGINLLASAHSLLLLVQP